MPLTKVVIYQEAIGYSPVVIWLKKLRKSDPKAWANCRKKGDEVSSPEIDIAVERKEKFRMNPKLHTYEEAI